MILLAIQFFALGVLCVEGWLAALLTSPHQMPVALPSPVVTTKLSLDVANVRNHHGKRLMWTQAWLTKSSGLNHENPYSFMGTRQ